MRAVLMSTVTLTVLMMTWRSGGPLRAVLMPTWRHGACCMLANKMETAMVLTLVIAIPLLKQNWRGSTKSMQRLPEQQQLI